MSWPFSLYPVKKAISIKICDKDYCDRNNREDHSHRVFFVPDTAPWSASPILYPCRTQGSFVRPGFRVIGTSPPPSYVRGHLPDARYRYLRSVARAGRTTRTCLSGFRDLRRRRNLENRASDRLYKIAGVRSEELSAPDAALRPDCLPRYPVSSPLWCAADRADPPAKSVGHTRSASSAVSGKDNCKRPARRHRRFSLLNLPIPEDAAALFFLHLRGGSSRSPFSAALGPATPSGLLSL